MIHLTENEQKIANAVREYANSRTPPTIARFAGGWVRDKIMGLSSHDIDVALDNLSGYTFATGLSERLPVEHSEEASRNAEDLPRQPSVHKIGANPDKSKHLETAVISIYGISVDFAHLRSEQYANSRIPTIKPGTPMEDAMRRDLTINSLFYNLNTGEIEDHTGRGLEDIERKIIRTPLDPKVTLLEDPLRILRIFRFKAKMGFSIDSSIYEALRLPEISSALRHKVSSERIEAELFKMFGYESGWTGMVEIIKTEYVRTIFAPESDVEVNKSLSLSFYDKCKEFVSDLQSSYNGSGADELDLSRNPLDIEGIVWGNVDIKMIWLYMALHNYASLEVIDGKHKEYVNVKILRDSLKCSKRWVTLVREVEEGIRYICSDAEYSTTRMALTCGKHIFEVLLICGVTGRLKSAGTIILELICKGLYNCYEVRPVINGHDLKNLGFISSGAYRKVLFECLVYQTDHPSANKEEILEFARNQL